MLKTLRLESRRSSWRRKRCVLYIIRVQTGANLLEILVKPISPEDDSTSGHTLLRDDFAAEQAYRAAPTRTPTWWT